MNKYIKYLIESFFDNIEDEITIDNISIDTNKKLYGILTLEECKTAEDYTEFVINELHIKELYEILFKNREILYEKCSKDNRSFAYSPPNTIPRYIINEFKNLTNISNVSTKKHNIIFKFPNNDNITISVYFYCEKLRLVLTVEYSSLSICKITNTEEIENKLLKGFKSIIDILNYKEDI